MYQLLKRYLFTLDPEEAHERTVKTLQKATAMAGGKALLNMLYGFSDKRLESTLWDIVFPNPVGMAAGFDKNAEVYHGLALLGFGYVEVGTVTPVSQPGNPRPRLFRLLEDQAVINRMGFNNQGAYTAAQNLQNFALANIPIGINIGKNKQTPNEEAARDYEKCLDALYNYGHYFVINVSSPNTPNLRDLQQADSLRQLLQAVKRKKGELERQGAKPKPMLVKVSPDMSDEQMSDVISVAVTEGVSGIIATNTTLSRDGLHAGPHVEETGGLSGKPLLTRSTALVREIYQATDGKLPIIGVGGIFSGQDAYQKIKAGASLVQVYTGMIYQGPGIVKQINQQLLRLLEQDGFSHISQAIGVEAK